MTLYSDQSEMQRQKEDLEKILSDEKSKAFRRSLLSAGLLVATIAVVPFSLPVSGIFAGLAINRFFKAKESRQIQPLLSDQIDSIRRQIGKLAETKDVPDGNFKLEGVRKWQREERDGLIKEAKDINKERSTQTSLTIVQVLFGFIGLSFATPASALITVIASLCAGGGIAALSFIKDSSKEKVKQCTDRIKKHEDMLNAALKSAHTLREEAQAAETAYRATLTNNFSATIQSGGKVLNQTAPSGEPRYASPGDIPSLYKRPER